jgi:ABC-type sugar transport system permease subunit
MGAYLSEGCMLKRNDKTFVIACLVPALVVYVVFFVFPALAALYVSLTDWSGFTPNLEFIGLRNFRELFADEHFWKVVIRNTLGIIFIGGAIIFALAFLFSAILSSGIKSKRLLRSIVFFPNIINPIGLAVMWSFIYEHDSGLLNNFLRAIGLGGLARTWAAPDRLFWSLLVALVWIYVGFFVVILMAGFDRIPNDVIESAKIEGANDVRIFFSIKVPMIWDVLTMAIVLWGIMALKEFAFLYSWGGGQAMPPEGAQNLAVYMYVMAFGTREPVYRMGYSTAMGVVMLIMVILMVLIVRSLMRRESVEY